MYWMVWHGMPPRVTPKLCTKTGFMWSGKNSVFRESWEMSGDLLNLEKSGEKSGIFINHTNEFFGFYKTSLSTAYA